MAWASPWALAVSCPGTTRDSTATPRPCGGARAGWLRGPGTPRPGRAGGGPGGGWVARRAPPLPFSLRVTRAPLLAGLNVFSPASAPAARAGVGGTPSDAGERGGGAAGLLKGESARLERRLY